MFYFNKLLYYKIQPRLHLVDIYHCDSRFNTNNKNFSPFKTVSFYFLLIKIAKNYAFV